MAEDNRLEELKTTRKMVQVVFLLMQKGLYPGEASESLVDARKFIDALYTKVQAEIVELEPKPVVKLEVVEPANEPTQEQSASV